MYTHTCTRTGAQRARTQVCTPCKTNMLSRYHTHKLMQRKNMALRANLRVPKPIPLEVPPPAVQRMHLQTSLEPKPSKPKPARTKPGHAEDSGKYLRGYFLPRTCLSMLHSNDHHNTLACSQWRTQCPGTSPNGHLATEPPKVAKVVTF